MTLQAKGFQWSMAIHGVLLLLFAVLQVFAVSQNQVTVIDFTFSGNSGPSAVEPSSPPRAPAARKEPKRTRAVRPEEISAAPDVKNPAPEKAPSSPPAVSSSGDVTAETPPRAADGPGSPSAVGKVTTASLPPAGGGSGTPSVKESGPHAGDTAGRAQDTADTAGATPEGSRAAYLREHFVYIRDRITGSISYPHLARKMGWCGQVKIAFIVCEDGGVNDVKVVESSGFSLLDRNAVDTVKNVAPFPTPPVRAEIRMAITYRLN